MKSAVRLSFSCPIWQAASRARRCTWMPVTISWEPDPRRIRMKLSTVGLPALAATLMLTGLGAGWKETPGMYAVIETNHGKIVAELFAKETPKTVENFVGLAEGTKEYTDPNLNQKVKRHFFDGLTFHRVIPDFMMQGGDPQGTGRGGPGYRFEDEIVSSLRFDKPGRLAMANSGP